MMTALHAIEWRQVLRLKCDLNVVNLHVHPVPQTTVLVLLVTRSKAVITYGIQEPRATVALCVYVMNHKLQT